MLEESLSAWAAIVVFMFQVLKPLVVSSLRLGRSASARRLRRRARWRENAKRHWADDAQREFGKNDLGAEGVIEEPERHHIGGAEGHTLRDAPPLGIIVVRLRSTCWRTRMRVSM